MISYAPFSALIFGAPMRLPDRMDKPDHTR